MANTQQNLSTAISVVQLLQMIQSLSATAARAIEGGRQEVTDDEMRSSLQANDEALQALRKAIERAQAEGR
jgi:hypothetical protein